MRHTLTLAALASLTLAACTPQPQHAPLEPGAYSLIATYADGNEYVIDYNLSPSDCSTYALQAARANAPQHIRLTCATQPINATSDATE